ncbi:MAG TPA: hypothetical protein VKA31_06315, partial [Mariprofundaceae bacterium]|nr:hypothetical protein [Mariprofundaceae bacterium]
MVRNITWFRWLLVFLAPGFGSAPVQAGEVGSIKPKQARVITTYESVKLPGNEKMGLLGGAILFDVRDWLSVGTGAYGALAGQRGGF